MMKKKKVKSEQVEVEKGNSKEELAVHEEKVQGKDILKIKQEEHDALLDKYARLQAEFDNYKKRSYKEKVEFIKFANEGLIMELLDILDNFERGIKAAEQKKDFDLLHQGVDMTSRQFHLLLETKGLNKIKCVGQKFDPHQHEAMEVEEDDSVDEDIVAEEMQSGYLLNGRIIRPAKVKVIKPKQKPVPSNKEQEQEIEEKEEAAEKEEIEKKEEDKAKIEEGEG